MRRLFALLCVVAFLALSVGAAGAAELPAYVNGIDANYPPFAFVGKDGKPTGFDVESMDWIANKMGFTVTHKPMDWNTIIPDLLAGKIDMVCAGMSITPERLERVNFSNPYFTMVKVLLVREKSTLTPQDIFTGNKRLGVQRGTNEAEWLAENRDKNGWNYELRYYDSAPMAVEDLVNGRVDAVGLDAAPAEDSINKARRPVRIIGEFADKDVFGVALRREDTDLARLINEGYELLKQDPFWEVLKAKYQVEGK